MRTVALSVLYFLVLTPIGIVLRCVNDPLARGWQHRADTYWISSATADNQQQRLTY